MEEKTILVTGAGGFVGARIMARHPQAIAFPSELLRRADKAQILSFARKVQPSVILHTAAISDIGTCERHPDDSYRANVLLTEALAIAAKETGAKLVAFSSDQVYTGCTEEGPYREAEDLPEPANVYARHKLEAEKRTLDLLPDAVMLRATWMYDMPMYGHANRGNFLRNVLVAARTGGQIPCVREQRRGITYVRQVAELLDQATALPGGAYNFGSENELTMPQTGAALLETAGQFVYVYAISTNAIVAAPMIASYSIFSVLWSRIFLKEKLSRGQYAMILLVMVGIAILGME